MDMTGLDKARALKALYDGARVAPMALLTGQARSEPLPIEEAREVLRRTPYVDYLHGRCIKVDFSGDYLDLRMYDRDHGEGSGEMRILDELTRPG